MAILYAIALLEISLESRQSRSDFAVATILNED